VPTLTVAWWFHALHVSAGLMTWEPILEEGDDVVPVFLNDGRGEVVVPALAVVLLPWVR